MKRLLLAALAFAASPLAGFAQSAVPLQISYQGRVTNAAGAPLGEPTPVNRIVIFRIWDHASSTATANRLYSEQQTVTIASGDFSVLIGNGIVVGTEAKPALDSVFTGTVRFIGVTVDDGDGNLSNDPEISPRQQIVTDAYSFRSKVAESVVNTAITTAMIANNAVTSIQVADSAIASSKIADLSILSNDLADGAITSAKILDGAVATADLANSAVANAKIADGAIDSAKIADGAIATADLANAAVTSAKIADATIATADLADSSVTSAKIADGTIATADLANSSVTLDKLAPASVGPWQLHSDLGGSNNGAGGRVHPFLRLYGGNTYGYIWSAYDTIGDGLNISYNNYNNNAGWTVHNTLGSQSRIHVGYGWLGFYTSYVGTQNGGYLRQAINHDGRMGFNTSWQDDVGYTFLAGYNKMVQFRDGLGAVHFEFQQNGWALKPGGGSWASLSDRRLKTDIRDLTGALDQLLKLRSVTFHYKDQKNHPAGVQTGFVAQEVEDVFPDWVSTGADGMKILGIRGFEARAVQAFRELRAEKDAEIAALKAQIAELRHTNLSAAQRLDAIERRLASPASAAVTANSFR